MNEKIEAIREGITFIQENWIGRALFWQGEMNDFIGAIKAQNVSSTDIRSIFQAMDSGEHVPLSNIFEIGSGLIVVVK